MFTLNNYIFNFNTIYYLKIIKIFCKLALYSTNFSFLTIKPFNAFKKLGKLGRIKLTRNI